MKKLNIFIFLAIYNLINQYWMKIIERIFIIFKDGDRMDFVASTGIINLDILYGGIDNLPKEGTEVFSSSFDVQLGGGAIASMINLKRCGVPVKLCTLVGKDKLSEVADEFLNQYELSYSNIYEGQSMPLTVTSVLITEGDRTFVSYRKDIKISQKMKDSVYKNSIGAKIVQIQEGFEDVYKTIKKEKPDTVFVYDTGWSDDLSIDNYRKYLEIADYYTPSAVEALKITGASNIHDAALVLKQFLKKVVIKLSGDGCYIMDEINEYIIPSLKEFKCIDSTGAGDAFLSGMLYGLFNDFSFEDCVSYGNIFGSFCVQGIGCLTSYPTVDELNIYKGRLLSDIKTVTVEDLLIYK